MISASPAINHRQKEKTDHVNSESTMSPSETSNDVAHIGPLLADAYGAKINAQDATGYAIDPYADDVLWAPPDAPDRLRRRESRWASRTCSNKFDPDVKLAAKEIEVMGDFAYGVGNVHLKLTPKARRRRSARQLVWLLVKHEGSWNIKRQIWNKKPIG